MKNRVKMKKIWNQGINHNGEKNRKTMSTASPTWYKVGMMNKKYAEGKVLRNLEGVQYRLDNTAWEGRLMPDLDTMTDRCEENECMDTGLIVKEKENA